MCACFVDAVLSCFGFSTVLLMYGQDEYNKIKIYLCIQIRVDSLEIDLVCIYKRCNAASRFG